MDKRCPLGRLYLGKKLNIYVDYYVPLAPHQIDGIRFLYRNFIKVKPGVILNDPTGYGKCLQVVCFLNAVQPLLTRPILILCEANAVEHWKDQFAEYTHNNKSNIAPETANAFENYSVFIKSMKDAPSFSRRNWGVVVVHDNLFSKETFQTDFNANFKIWVTSVNLKDNLRTFALIYEWIHPNTKVNIADFEPKSNKPQEVLEKLILVDAFLEDILIRRSGVLTLFESKRKLLTQQDDVSPIKVTRKNKDPTGKKVKRSKRKIEDDETVNVIENFSNKDLLYIGNKEVTSKSNNIKVNVENAFDSNNEFCFLEANNGPNKNKAKRFHQEENVAELKNRKELSNDDSDDADMHLSVNLFSESEPTMKFQTYIDDIVENENKAHQLNENDFAVVTCENKIQDSLDSEDYVIVDAQTDLRKRSYLNYLKDLADRNKHEAEVPKGTNVEEIKEENFFNINESSNNLCNEIFGSRNELTISEEVSTRKNKDPTGMKVKRSKKVDDNEILNINANGDMLGTRELNGSFNNINVSGENNLNDYKLCETISGDDNKKIAVENVSRNKSESKLNSIKDLSDVEKTSQLSVNLFSEKITQNSPNEIVENEHKMNTLKIQEPLFSKETDENNPLTEKSDTKAGSDNLHDKIVESIEAKESKKDVLDTKSARNQVDISKEDNDNVKDKVEAKTVPVTKDDKVSKNSIDDVLATFEQEALKKFKGSFLDRLF